MRQCQQLVIQQLVRALDHGMNTVIMIRCVSVDSQESAKLAILLKIICTHKVTISTNLLLHSPNSPLNSSNLPLHLQTYWTLTKLPCHSSHLPMYPQTYHYKHQLTNRFTNLPWLGTWVGYRALQWACCDSASSSSSWYAQSQHPLGTDGPGKPALLSSAVLLAGTEIDWIDWLIDWLKHALGTDGSGIPAPMSAVFDGIRKRLPDCLMWYAHGTDVPGTLAASHLLLSLQESKWMIDWLIDWLISLSFAWLISYEVLPLRRSAWVSECVSECVSDEWVSEALIEAEIKWTTHHSTSKLGSSPNQLTNLPILLSH